MSITSRINEMSSHIEQAYDELQGLGADLTNVDKNIENISMVLDDIYDSMPQVSGEGTSLTLDDTRVGKIKSTLKGNTSQSGTPTPSSPIPVNVVSGDNSIEICGKNYFINTLNMLKKNNTSGTWNGNVYTANNVTFTYNEDGSIKVTGQASANTNFYISRTGESYSYFTLPAGTYYFTSHETTGSNTTWKTQFNDGTSFNIFGSGNSKEATRTYSENTNISGYLIVYSGYNPNGVTFYPMIAKTSGIDYEPYTGNTYNIDLPVENLLDKTNNLFQGTFTVATGGDDSVTDQSTRCCTKKINIKGLSGSLTFSGSYFDLYAFYDENGTNLGSGSSTTFTIPTNATSVRLRFYNGGSALPLTTLQALNLQLGKDSKANKYTPYGTIPIELCKIGNYQDYFGNSDGRNLFDGEVELGSINTAGDVTTNNALRSVNYIKVKPNTQYTISNNLNYTTRIYEYNNSKTYVTSSTQATSTYTFTTSTTTEYIRFRTIEGSVQNNLNIQVMLNEGLSALPWQPYGVGKWYLHKEIGKVVLNGSESGWGYDTTSHFFVNATITGFSRTQTIYSDYYKGRTPVSSGSNLNDNEIAFSSNTSNNRLYIKNGNITSADDFKTWLSAHNTIVYYVYDTSTNIEITYQPLIDQLNLIEKAQSKENQTNISQVNNDLPFKITASALKEWSV